MTELRIVPITGIGEVAPGTNLAMEIADAAEQSGTPLVDGDVVVVTSKVVSKAEGCQVELDSVRPSRFAAEWATRWNKDARVIEVVLSESARIVRQVGPVLITETHHGFVCANAGVDQSSSGAVGRVLTLPVDPDASAASIRSELEHRGRRVAVVITDTFGRPWRNGQTDIAIGISGFAPVRSYVGQQDPHGHEFQVQEICVADELAAAAELVKGNTSRVPAAIIRGYPWLPDDEATIRSVLRESSMDLFR